MGKSLYTVYSQRLAGFLMMNGFPLIELVKNQTTRKNYFIFPNAPMLKEYIDKWERYLEEKEINIDMHEGLDIIMNAIVELKNKQRVSKKGQYDIFLDDENFLKSDTFNWFNKRNEKYKLGLLTYDNEKSYA